MRSIGMAVLIGTMALAAAPSARAQGVARKPGAPPAAAATTTGAGPIVVVETEKGTFEFETYPNEAPKTTAYILALVRKHFYNGQRFHRVIPDFVIQVGDPASRDFARKDEWGYAGSGSTVGVGEFSKLRTHVRGAVALAHPGDPRKGDSQFYVTLSAAPRLDGSYTVFGRVVAGMDVVTKIGAGDRVNRVTVKGDK
jgi:peptidyl-prolyl cis-trans isomerase B (cyclophilin B)